MNRRVLVAVGLLWFAAPAVAAAQAEGSRVSIQGAAGTHLNVGGDTQSVAIGLSLHERLELLIGAERLHIPSEAPSGTTRGGTSIILSGEVRFSPVTFERLSPYVLASAGRGTSRPNVNDTFPSRVTNDAWLLFFGGGARVPVTERLSVFGDVRFGIQGELDTVFLLVPVRAGVAWRF